LVTTNEDTPVTVTLPHADVDDPADSLSGYICNAQQHGTIPGVAKGDTVVSLGSLTVTYTPDSHFVGTDAFTYLLADPSNAVSDCYQVTITVLNVPDAQDQTVSVPEDHLLDLDLTPPDPDTTSLTYQLDSGTAHGALLGSLPHLTYVPDANWSGSDSFSYSVTDGPNTVTATVTLDVTPVDDPPVAQNEAVATLANQALGITLAASDIDDTGPFRYLQCAGPAHGTLAGVTGSGTVEYASSTLTYQPAPGFTGTDSFTYLAVDPSGVRSPCATVTISVASSGPALSIDDVSVTEPAKRTSTATFTISLAQPAPGPVSVTATTADGTAIAPGDYLSKTALLKFKKGESSKTFAVTINADSVVEPAEQFYVNLSNASGATISDAQGIGTIQPR
jgi:hypothetical protein